MISYDYASLEDESLADLLYYCEDRLELAAALEICKRDGLVGFMAQTVINKHNWQAELPEWWAVVHSSYLLGHRGGEEVVNPLLSALRWADAFDCDWVTEQLPSIFRRVGPPLIPGLTAVARDVSAGWSVRDLAMKGLAAISLDWPDSTEHVFRIIGERFMDESEERPVRQLSGQILMDFCMTNYRMALIQFAREEQSLKERDVWYAAGFDPDEVEWVFRRGKMDVWHYQEDWMRFYDPAEIQRRQKRWARERLGSSGAGAPSGAKTTGGGLVVPLNRKDKNKPGAGHGRDPLNPEEDGE